MNYLLRVVALMGLTGVVFAGKTVLVLNEYGVWEPAGENAHVPVSTLGQQRAPDLKKWTPLMVASCVGSSTRVAALLADGEDAELTRDEEFLTPLHLAVLTVPNPVSGGQEQLQTIQQLLDADANPFSHTRSGRTALHFAAGAGVSIAVLQLLLDDCRAKKHAVNLVMGDERGNTPVHAAVIAVRRATGHERTQLLVKMLLLAITMPISLKTKNKCGNDPFEIAYLYGDQDSMRILLTGGYQLSELQRERLAALFDDPFIEQCDEAIAIYQLLIKVAQAATSCVAAK